MLSDCIQQQTPMAKVPPLRSIYIYLTDECNQRCPHCWISPTVKGMSRLNRPRVEDYCGFIKQAMPIGLNFVKLTGGEPLLRNEIFPIIEFASQLDVLVSVETNGMLVGEREAEFFKTHGVHISVSLDGASAEVHDPRRGVQGAFEKTIRALKLITEVGVPLTVVAAISRSNYNEIEKILELLCDIKRSSPIDFKINPITPMGRARRMVRCGEILNPHELLGLVERVRTQLIPKYSKHGIGIVLQLEIAFFPLESILQKAGTTGVGHCGFLNLISVLADGSITFCGIGYAARHLIMGNIREQYDLQWIWNHHPVLTDVRQKVYNALEGVCQVCLFHPVCLGGCRAAAIAAGGSVVASPPFCQSLYDAGLFPLSRIRPDTAAEYEVIAPRLRAEYEAHVRSYGTRESNEQEVTSG